ncbi:hypothetical protein [Streptomyces hydrogenans]
MAEEDVYLSGADWITQSLLTSHQGSAARFEARRLEALESRDRRAAETAAANRDAFLWETLLRPGGESKRVVSDEEAVRLHAEETERREAEEIAARMAEFRKEEQPRASGSAFRPYSGGLPSLGRRRR